MMTENSTQITPTQARTLAELAHELRPDWDTQGIVAAIYAARERGSNIDVCLATIRAAAEPTNRTPAVLKYDGSHWREPERGTAPTPRGHRLCMRCREPHPPSTACTGQPPGAIDRDSPTRLAARTAARQAILAATGPADRAAEAAKRAAEESTS